MEELDKFRLTKSVRKSRRYSISSHVSRLARVIRNCAAVIIVISRGVAFHHVRVSSSSKEERIPRELRLYSSERIEKSVFSYTCEKFKTRILCTWSDHLEPKSLKWNKNDHLHIIKTCCWSNSDLLF